MTVEDTTPRPDFHVLDVGPDRTFRVSPAATVDTAGAGLPAARGVTAAFPARMTGDLGQIPEVTATMLTGPWLAGPAGPVPGGTLGVLVDGLSAFAVLLGRPEATWSVSAEISADLCAPVPADGSVLTGTARIAGAGPHGGLGSGRVTDADGRVIAQFRQHTRWVPGPADIPGEFAERALVPADGLPAAADLTELLGARVQAADGGAVIEIPVTSALTNPMGNMHGGVIFTAVDLAAQAALQSVGGPVRTASLHVAYPRPVRPGVAGARFEAQVRHRGRSFGIVEVTSRNEARKPCVIATVTTTSD